MVILHTTHGDIKLELDAENAPATVANFLQYVRDEAHRFAQHYHHLLRKKRTLGEEE